jgi:hypothetical protein
VAHLVCFASSSENSEHLQSQIQKKTQIVDSCIIKVGSGKHALSGVCEMVKPEPGMHVDFGPETRKSAVSLIGDHIRLIEKIHQIFR